jgi:hypothetical protein
VLRSDAYAITAAHTVEAVVEAVPLVKLDDAHYKLVDKMEALTHTVPSLAKVGGGRGRAGGLWPVAAPHPLWPAAASCRAGLQRGRSPRPPAPSSLHVRADAPQATSLTVKGPVRFGPGVVIVGKVVLENPSKDIVTVANQTFQEGSHVVAPVAAPAAQPVAA